MRKVLNRIDRNLLHEYMWKNRDPRSGKFTHTQLELADELGVTNATISHIFSEMRAAGRIKKRGASFYVTDPQVWRWRNLNVGDGRDEV